MVESLSMLVPVGVLEERLVAVGGGISSEGSWFGVGTSKCGILPVSGSAVCGVLSFLYLLNTLCDYFTSSCGYVILGARFIC